MRVPPRTHGRTKVRAELSAISRAITLPVQEYIHAEEAAGLMLVVGAVAGLVWANSFWAESYPAFWDTTLTIDLGLLTIAKTARHWVNDGLMVFFFLLVGLEIKREMVHGQLSTRRQAALPVFAALGGMILPAGLYLLFTLGHAGARGWGVPVATDIAFALGVLALLGRRVPTELKIFLLALATVDDLGGILIIAVFYAHGLSMTALAIAAALAVLIIVLRRSGVRSAGVFGLVGVLLWLAVLKSGVHATIAGVVIGLLTPARILYDPREVAAVLRERLNALRAAIERDENDEAEMLLGQIEELTRGSEEPLQRIERHVRPWVSYVVLPIFALANSGVVLSREQIAAALDSPVAHGAMVGLLLGKVVGVAGATWLAVRLRLVALPNAVNWSHIIGAGLLAGIGFTVSLFIAELAFEGSALLPHAKRGILAASAAAAVLGGGFLLVRTKPRT
jgi:NhaA family Na+:H+ antiporter